MPDHFSRSRTRRLTEPKHVHQTRRLTEFLTILRRTRASSSYHSHILTPPEEIPELDRNHEFRPGRCEAVRSGKPSISALPHLILHAALLSSFPLLLHLPNPFLESRSTIMDCRETNQDLARELTPLLAIQVSAALPGTPERILQASFLARIPSFNALPPRAVLKRNKSGDGC